MTVFFTSDTHFGHKNIIKYASRPFENASEMDQMLLDNINSRVGEDDVLYILGDFCMGRGIDKQAYARELLEKINCRHVFLVRGNHDVHDKDMLRSLGFEDVYDYHELKASGKMFCLMHYPLAEWNGFYRGAYDLHGHVHNDASYNASMRKEGILRYDVGVDANGYMPVSLEEIISFFE